MSHQTPVEPSNPVSGVVTPAEAQKSASGCTAGQKPASGERASKLRAEIAATLRAGYQVVRDIRAMHAAFDTQDEGAS